MGMEEYGCFMQYVFIISETIGNIEHEELICFIGYRCFSKNLFMSIKHMKKIQEQIQGSHHFSFFSLRSLLTQTGLHFHKTRQLTSSEH